MYKVLGGMQDFVTKKMYGKEEPTSKEKFGDLVDKDMDGNEVQMSSFKGSVLVITNVASK
jgi:glutathione peroxidase-family protein